MEVDRRSFLLGAAAIVCAPAVLRAAQNVINIFDPPYSALGDGSDETAKWQAALATRKDVDGRRGLFGLSSTIALAEDYQAISNAKFTKIANCDMINVSRNLARLRDVVLFGNGQSYSGRGVIASAGVGQKIDNLNAWEMEGFCFEAVGDGVASSLVWSGGAAQRKVATNAAIKLPDDASLAGIRRFNDVHAYGGSLFDHANSNMTLVSGGSSVGAIFGAGSARCKYEAHRIAFAMNVFGVAHQIVNCTIGGALTINGNGHIIGPNVHQGGQIILAPGATNCTIYKADAVVLNNSGNLTNVIV